MAQRERLITQAEYPWMKSGLVQTLAVLEGSAPEQAAQHAQQLIEDDASIQDVYRLLQGRLGAGLLVDKSPSSTFHPAYLARAEDLFEEPKYLYLARHPYATIESFVRMRFHWLIGNQFPMWDVNPWLFAEKCWADNSRNAIDFLADIAGERQYWIRYEDLVTDPERVMRRVCDLLGVRFDDAVLDPYGDSSATFGLGDPNLLNYQGIDATLATAWEKNPPPQQLSPFTKDVAAELGYVLG